MKNVVIATYEGIYSLPLVEACLKNKNFKVVKILKSSTLYADKAGINGIFFLLRKVSVFFLFPKFFELVLFFCYRSALPIRMRPFKTLLELSDEYQVPVEEIYDINEYPHSENNNDVIFSIYFNQIFSAKTLSCYGRAFNIHPAPLPVGRGLFSQFWLLLNPYSSGKYYQTIHRMTHRVDDGEVIQQRSVEQERLSPSMADFMNKVTVLGINMLLDFDFNKSSDVHSPRSQSYNSFPQTRDVFNFWKKNLHFFKVRDIKNYFQIKVSK